MLCGSDAGATDWASRRAGVSDSFSSSIVGPNQSGEGQGPPSPPRPMAPGQASQAFRSGRSAGRRAALNWNQDTSASQRAIPTGQAGHQLMILDRRFRPRCPNEPQKNRLGARLRLHGTPPATKEHSDIAVADAPRDAKIRHVGSIKGDLASLDKALRKLISRGQPLHIVYAAGPCGILIQRHLQSQDRHCDVVASSSIARPLGERIRLTSPCTTWSALVRCRARAAQRLHRLRRCCCGPPSRRGREAQ